MPQIICKECGRKRMTRMPHTLFCCAGCRAFWERKEKARKKEKERNEK